MKQQEGQPPREEPKKKEKPKPQPLTEQQLIAQGDAICDREPGNFKADHEEFPQRRGRTDPPTRAPGRDLDESGCASSRPSTRRRLSEERLRRLPQGPGRSRRLGSRRAGQPPKPTTPPPTPKPARPATTPPKNAPPWPKPSASRSAPAATPELLVVVLTRAGSAGDPFRRLADFVAGFEGRRHRLVSRRSKPSLGLPPTRSRKAFLKRSVRRSGRKRSSAFASFFGLRSP